MNTKTVGSILVAAFSAVIVLLLLVFRDAPVEAVYPVERARTGFVRSVWTRLQGAVAGSRAAAENARLRRELETLALVSGDIVRLEEENDRLRSVLAYAEKSNGAWLPAAVLSRDGGAAGRAHTLRLGRGSNGDVRIGAIVAVPDGLVGIITRVTPHTSEVTLVTDPSVMVACEIACGASRRPFGILCGGTDDLLVLRHLNRTENIPERSHVITSGRGGVFPRGLLVGTLSRRVDAPCTEAGVLPAVDFATLEDVFVRRVP